METLDEQNQGFLKPEDKFMLYRLIPVCLFWLDTSDDPKALLRNKGELAVHFLSYRPQDWNLSRAQKFIKQYPIIPLFGDIHFNCLDILKQCPSLAQLPEWSTELVKGKPTNLYALSGVIDSDR